MTLLERTILSVICVAGAVYCFITGNAQQDTARILLGWLCLAFSASVSIGVQKVAIIIVMFFIGAGTVAALSNQTITGESVQQDLVMGLIGLACFILFPLMIWDTKRRKRINPPSEEEERETQQNGDAIAGLLIIAVLALIFTLAKKALGLS